jgi:spermidine/putrescine-binding protein
MAWTTTDPSPTPEAAQETLNAYNWTGYIAPDTVANFERETGIYSTAPEERRKMAELFDAPQGYC